MRLSVFVVAGVRERRTRRPNTEHQQCPYVMYVLPGTRYSFSVLFSILLEYVKKKMLYIFLPPAVDNNCNTVSTRLELC